MALVGLEALAPSRTGLALSLISLVRDLMGLDLIRDEKNISHKKYGRDAEEWYGPSSKQSYHVIFELTELGTIT